MQLTLTDSFVILVYFVISLGVGIYFRKRATGSVSEFFISGRNVTWWLAGTSMVATTFAADTPLAVTELVAKHGIAGNWIWWSFLFSGMMTVFFFAKLWRRAGVMTDVEFAEIRYSGKPAAFLRGFRALYLGIPVNLLIMGWVNLAMINILSILLGVSKFEATLLCIGIMALTSSVSTLSGLWGVLVMDFFQFILVMIVFILLAVYALDAVGGMEELRQGLLALDAAKQTAETTDAGSVLSFIPDLGSLWMPLITFLVYIAVNWWATWYPGAEPGGGGYVAQRIFSAKDEKHSILATFWFNIAHYALRPWPWILVALVAMVLYQSDPAFIADPKVGFIRVMLDHTPASLRGVIIAAFLAAYMSTIATQLNWGASYIINDFYRRFLKKIANEKHYVRVSQLVTVLMMLTSALVAFQMDSISGAWKFLIALGAGTGLVYILRWFWWRINAWSEVSAMVTAFVVSVTLQVTLQWTDADPRQFAYLVLATTTLTTIVWVAVTLLTKPESNEVLLAFYRRVRPSVSMWGPIPSLAPEIVPAKEGAVNLFHWALGCVTVYGVLFGTGKIIFGEYLLGVIFIAIGFLALFAVLRSLSVRGWESIAR